MKDTAIKVEGLSKRYRIGLEEEEHDTLVGALTSWVKQPVKSYRRLKKLSHFGEDEEDADDIIWALRDVSFEVERGEVVGIIGRNGAGKSTLLKILSRITEPTRGYADIRGRVSSLLEVGTGFHEELTGRENVYLNGTILGMTKAEVDRKFDEIVAFSGVEKFIDTPVKRYSSGMKVRLAFAVAAHLEPEILLIDEVLAVGDAAFQKKCLGKMESVTEEGRTVLFVSHQMGAIRSLCDRTILLEGGRIRADTSTEEALQIYLRGSDVSESGEVVWSESARPHAEGLSLHSIRLLGEEERSTDVISMHEGFAVEVVYSLDRPIRRLRLFIKIRSELGEDVFTSYEDSMVVAGKERGPGAYRACCRIAPHLLNDRTYSVYVGFDIPNKKVILPGKDYLKFRVVDTSEGYRYRSRKAYAGLVRPQLDWSTQALELQNHQLQHGS